MRDFLVVPPTSHSSISTRCEMTISVPKWYCMKSVVVETHTWPIRDNPHTACSSRKGRSLCRLAHHQRCRILMVLRWAGAPAHHILFLLRLLHFYANQGSRGESSKLQASDELLHARCSHQHPSRTTATEPSEKVPQLWTTGRRDASTAVQHNFNFILIKTGPSLHLYLHHPQAEHTWPTHLW